jgi:chromosome segregation ATPase
MVWSLILNVLLIGVLIVLYIGVNSLKSIKEELTKKNNELDKEIQVYKKHTEITDKEIKEKEESIRNFETLINDNLEKINNLKKEVKQSIRKKSKELQSLSDCKKEYEKLHLYNLNLQSQNEEFNNVLKIVLKQRDEYKSIIPLKDSIIFDKDQEIKLLNQKCANYEVTVKRLTYIIKRPKIGKTFLKVGTGIVLGVIVGKKLLK